MTGSQKGWIQCLAIQIFTEETKFLNLKPQTIDTGINTNENLGGGHTPMGVPPLLAPASTSSILVLVTSSY